MRAKTLTIRLEIEDALKLAEIQKQLEIKTASKALMHCLHELSTVDELKAKIAEYENILDGLNNAADKLKAALNVIDQRELNL